MEWKFPDWAAINGPAINILKGAILAADRVMTVSQVHFQQIFIHLTNQSGMLWSHLRLAADCNMRVKHMLAKDFVTTVAAPAAVCQPWCYMHWLNQPQQHLLIAG